MKIKDILAALEDCDPEMEVAILLDEEYQYDFEISEAFDSDLDEDVMVLDIQS